MRQHCLGSAAHSSLRQLPSAVARYQDRHSGITYDARHVFSRQMDFVRHFRDLLIAVEAARAGATLVSENVGDFARWRSILAFAKKTLKLFKPS